MSPFCWRDRTACGFIASLQKLSSLSCGHSQRCIMALSYYAYTSYIHIWDDNKLRQHDTRIHNNDDDNDDNTGWAVYMNMIRTAIELVKSLQLGSTGIYVLLREHTLVYTFRGDVCFFGAILSSDYYFEGS